MSRERVAIVSVGLKGFVPLPIRARARSMLNGRRVTSDLRSFWAFQQLEREAGEPVAIRLKALGGLAVLLRPGTTDRRVAVDLCTRPYHRPPAAVHPAAILDLGANIGLTMVDMAVLYPAARIVGVELDPANAELARRNVARFGERCEVITAAVWTDDGTVPYQTMAGAEWTSRIDRGDHGDEWGTNEVRSLSLSSLVEKLGDVDFIKMDIEGAEKDVLRGDDAWAKHVGCMNVEAHHPYSVDECIADLRRLGFDASIRNDGGGIVHIIARATS